MKHLILMVMFVLSMNIAKSQVFILGDAAMPNIGVMIHFQTMETPQLGFYNYAVYGDSHNKDFKMISLSAGLSYYIAKKHQKPDPQDCIRFYLGFNHSTFWRGDEIIYPNNTHTISFDLGVSRTFDRFTGMIMIDPLNVSVKPGISYYF